MVWLRSFGTRRLLWFGFGVLTFVIVSISIIVIVRVHSVASNIEKQTKIAKPRSATAREMELILLDYALGVHQYLRGDDLARLRGSRYAADVALQLDGYTALAETARQRELAARLQTGWQDVHALGEALMAARTANREEVAASRKQVTRLEQLSSFRVAAGRGRSLKRSVSKLMAASRKPRSLRCLCYFLDWRSR